MKNKVNVLLTGLFLCLLFTSCEWKNEEEDIGIVECDTSQVTLSGNVKPILETNCYRCHSTENAPFSGVGIDLEDYASLKVRADGGSLFGSINHSSSFSPMPKGASKISTCDISLIEAWIEKGALND